MRLSFEKMSGAGNDFVAIEDRGSAPGGMDWAGLARRLCERRSGVGADGLLVLKAGAKPAMRYFNADGSRAFCGNGSRCAAWWLRRRGSGKRLVISTDEGPLDAEITGKERVRIKMPEPRGLRLGLRLSAAGRAWPVHFVDTGVPHAVVPAGGLDRLPVFEAGRALRRHPAFRPAGANVDFADWTKKTVRVRTYERGVEDETLACGTGAVATALIAAALGKAKPPVRISVRSGDVLSIHFQARGPGRLPREVWLEGPAKVTFRGEVEI